MALFPEKEDTRPRNPEHRALIAQMYDPKRLLEEMAEGDNTNLDSEHSIDDHLDNTDDFRDWARQRRKGTNLDPEKRKPMQISDSPLSDYNVEFTRLNKSSDAYTPSSLSSLIIPQASSASLSQILVTPSHPRKNSRTSNAMHRKSEIHTPKSIIRKNQMDNVKRLTRMTMEFPKNFAPMQCSTPVHDRKRSSILSRLENVVNGGREPAITNLLSENAQENGENIPTSTIENRSERTLTNENQAAEPLSTSRIPESQPHDTIIPETQDIPDTQDVVPETQEDEMPATQDDVASNPVQAPGTPQNTEQQAESRGNILEISARKIQSRPPIRGQSQIATPSNSKYVHPTTPFRKSAVRTPSRLPIAISRTTPKPTELPPVLIVETSRPHVGEVSSSNNQNAEASRPLTLHALANQSAAMSPTVIPAPNITVNVNVSNTKLQSPHQTTQTNRKPDQNIENAINSGDDGDNSGGDRRNNSNESLLTNDSDSNGNEQNWSNSRCRTPKKDGTSSIVRRRLFSNDDAEQTRRSATFNKVDNLTRTIDNRTQTISGDSPNNSPQFRTRSKNNITNTVVKSSSVIAPSSQTFDKPKLSLQNATYDVPAESPSIRQLIDKSRTRIGINTEEFIALTSPNRTNNENGSAFSNMADLPSEAQLESIVLTDDEEDAANPIVDLNVQNKNDVQPSRNNNTRNEMQKSRTNRYNSMILKSPRVMIHRISTKPTASLSNRKPHENISNVRDSRSYAILPPEDFQNTDVIVELSPATQKVIEKRISSLQKTVLEPQNVSMVSTKHQSKRSTRNKLLKDENLAIVEKNLKNIGKKAPSEKPKPRRLRSVNLNDSDDDNNVNVIEPVERTETSNTNQSTAQNDGSVFKMPDAPPPRVSRTTNTNKSANGTASNVDESHDQEELIVTVNIQPLDDDNNFDTNNHATDNEPSSSNQRDASPPPKQKGKAQPKKKVTKNSSRSKSKTKEPQVTTETEQEPSNNVTSTETGMRRSTRVRAACSDFMLRSEILMGGIRMNHSKAEKRKSKATYAVIRTAPVLPNRKDPESEPPRKKQRAQSEIGRKITRPSSATQSVKSMQIGSSTGKFNKSMGKHMQEKFNNIAAFIQDFDGHIKRKTQEKLQWWKELLDINEKGPIIHHNDEVDIEYINTAYGQMEISYTDKIAYTEMDGVDYGFVPARERRIGIMRFKPKSVKVKGKTAAELELHILYGEFILQHDDGELEVFAGTDITIPKDAKYGLVNCSDDVGIIHFTYAKL